VPQRPFPAALARRRCGLAPPGITPPGWPPAALAALDAFTGRLRRRDDARERRSTTFCGRDNPANLEPTERGTPFTPDAVNRMIKTIGARAKLPMPVHCHMLRHSCGYKLANDGIDTRAIQDWLGHVSITHTTRYTQLSPVRFKDFWRD
jgi:site-specific recombinase XerD